MLQKDTKTCSIQKRYDWITIGVWIGEDVILLQCYKVNKVHIIKLTMTQTNEMC